MTGGCLVGRRLVKDTASVQMSPCHKNINTLVQTINGKWSMKDQKESKTNIQSVHCKVKKIQKVKIIPERSNTKTSKSNHICQIQTHPSISEISNNLL